MMKRKNLVLLCGQNSDNLPWLEKIGKFFKVTYNINILKYSHWENDSEMNFDVELNKLEDMLSKLGDFSIVAKSAGGLLALMALKRGYVTREQKMIIIGTPLKWARDRNIDVEPFISNSPSILYIQGTNDPKGNYASLIGYLRKPYNVIKYYSDNHSYRKVKTICNYIGEFLQ